MRWDDERFIKVYTRDTPEWVMLGWAAQSVFVLILRKVDRAGIMPLGKKGTKGLAALLGMPLEILQPALDTLLEDGCVMIHGGHLIIRNFLPAQETPANNAARKRTERERARDTSTYSEKVAENEEMSRGVTPSHELSQTVTPRLDKTRLDKTRQDKPREETEAEKSRPRDSTSNESVVASEPPIAPPPPSASRSQRPEKAPSARLTAVPEPKRPEARTVPQEPTAPPPNASNGDNPALSRILENLRKYPQLAKVATEEFAVHVVDKTLGTNVNEAILDKVLEEFAYKHEPSDNLDSLKRQLGGFLLSAHRNPKKYLDLIRAEPLRKAGPVPIERYVPVPEPEDGIVLTKEIWDDLLKTMDNGMNPRSRKRAGNELRPTGGGREQARGPARA